MRGRHRRDVSARPSAQAGGAQQRKAQDTSGQGRTAAGVGWGGVMKVRGGGVEGGEGERGGGE